MYSLFMNFCLVKYCFLLIHKFFYMTTKFCILFTCSSITRHCIFDKICSWYCCLVCTYRRCCSQYFSIYFPMVIYFIFWVVQNAPIHYHFNGFSINILSCRVTWKQKSDSEIKDQVAQRDVNTYFAFALIATISTVSTCLMFMIQYFYYYSVKYISFYLY